MTGWKDLLARVLEVLTSMRATLSHIGYVALGILLMVWNDQANEGKEHAKDVEDWDGRERRLRTRGDVERERLRKLSGKK